MYMEFKNYIGKTILGWLFYHYNDSFEESYGNKCYVYPRILVTGEKYQIINPNDFPQSGRILVRIQGGESAEEVYKRFGSLVSIRINAEPYPNYNSNNVYSMKYSYQHGRTSSEIWIERFDGKGFYQVVDTDSEITTIRKERSLKKPDFELSANFVMLRHGSKLYGPFEYEIKEEEMNLFAARSNQYFVGEYDAIAYNDELCVVTDQNGKEAVLLLPKATVSAPLECTNYYDWIRDETLIDGFMEALRSGNEYTKDQIRQIKDSAKQFLENYSNVQFTDQRVERVQQLLQDMVVEEEQLRAMVQYALSDSEMKQKFVEELVQNYFEQIKDKIPEYAVVRNHIDELKREETVIEERLKEKIDWETEHKDTIGEHEQEEILSLMGKNEELQKENKELLEIVNAVKDIDALRSEHAHWVAKRDTARENYNQQLLDNKKIEEQFDKTIDNFQDRAKQTARVLDSKLLDRILRSVGEEPEENTAVTFNVELLHEPMSAKDIVERVSYFIKEKAHRDVTENDVANYLICFKIILKWFQYGEFSLEKEQLLLQVKTLDKLFEYFCLLKLLGVLASHGYQIETATEPSFKFEYSTSDGRYQNEKDVANTYLLRKENTKVTLYYQPVVSSFQFENGLSIFRTTVTHRGDYYTPDFVLKITRVGEKEVYAIFDSKFSPRKVIREYGLPEIIRKYSCEIATQEGTPPKMIWALQGRVDSREKPIWKYHNAPLASRYIPQTSYGIISVNTMQGENDFLWDELKRNIPWLA